jgi:hypothetical protein
MVEIIASDDCEHLYVICIPYNIICVSAQWALYMIHQDPAAAHSSQTVPWRKMFSTRATSELAARSAQHSPIMYGCDEEVVLLVSVQMFAALLVLNSLALCYYCSRRAADVFHNLQLRLQTTKQHAPRVKRS